MKRYHGRKFAGAAIAALLMTGTAQAQAPAAEESCVTYDSAYEAAPLMQVSAAPGARVHFQDQARACPAKGGCGWKRKAYLTAGDVVLASAPRAGFRCVYYGSAGGKLSAGFLPVSALRPMADPAGVSAAVLAGRWREEGGNSIAITAAGSALRAEGKATYEENVGEFAGKVAPSGNGFTVTDGDCRVTARRRGPYLAVRDNNACGGMNVSFGGLYTRTR
jgi:hypothetical protein